jgi:serine/threonine protein kinase/Cdc6-like AAA superfamily ATPase
LNSAVAQAGDHQVRLPPTFRYLHAPVGSTAANGAVGRHDAACAFADRLMFSNGGALLVSGFRGVGKTTFVQFALAHIETHHAHYEHVVGPFQLVDVWINLAKPVTAAQLMHLLIRQLYLRLESMKLLARLEPALQHDLHTAFMRTCFEISARSVATEERGRDMSVGFERAPLLGLEFLGKLAATAKSTRSDEDVMKYLPYDEKAAESDLLDFSNRMARTADETPPLPWFRRWWKRWKQEPDPLPKLKVVFVLDELDKLEKFAAAGKDGTSPLDPLFEALKTVFTGTAFSYVFIAGKEAHERWTHEVALGDSIYESVFGYDVYLPCLWSHQHHVIDMCLFGGDATPRPEDEDLAPFRRYLCYHGRGIPRRILRELNRHVRWENGRPVLAFAPEQKRVMAVFAKMQDLLENVNELLEASVTNTASAADDRRRLALYYLVDEVLRRGKRTFKFGDLNTTAQQLNLGGGRERIPREAVEQILQLLLKRGIVERVSRTIVGPDRAAAESADEYRVAEWVLRALEPVLETPATPFARPEPPPGLTHIGRYRVVATTGQGGFATVYRVVAPSGEVRAAKLLRTDYSDSADLEKRFQREIEILARLKHRSIVRIYEHGTHGSTPYFIMDYIEGSSLQSLLSRTKRLTPTAAAFTAARLADVYAYIHDLGVVRNDIKPSNVMIDSEGQLVIIDFGISHLEGASTLTATQSFLGTPGYMSPEHARGGTVDRRSDVFSLGVLLYEMVTGTPPFRGSSIVDEIMKVLNETPPPPSTLAPISTEFDAVIMKALAKEPDDRFASMKELAEALGPYARQVNLAAMAQDVEASAADVARHSTIIEWPTVSSDSLLMPVTPALVPVTATPPPYRVPPQPAAPDTVRGPLPAPPPATAPAPARPVPPLPRAAPPPVQAPSPSPPPVVPQAAGPAQAPPAAAPLPSPATGIMPRPARFSVTDSDDLELLFDLDKGLLVTSWEPDRVVSLAKGQVILGRALTCDIVVNKPSLSRQHVMFSIADGRVTVGDLGSRGGVSVDGRKIREAALADGQKIELGNVKARILYGPI